MDKITYENMLNESSDKTLIELVTEVSEHKNELVLEGWTVCLLLEGIANDTFDWYYRLVVPNEGIVYYSCVGRITYLKDKIDEEDYNYIFNLFKLNYDFWGKNKLNKILKESFLNEEKIQDQFKEIKRALND